MKTQKTRLEEVEETASPEQLIIALNTADNPELLDDEIMAKKQAEYKSENPDKDIVFIIVKRDDNFFK